MNHTGSQGQCLEIRTSWEAKRTTVLEGDEDKANLSSIPDGDFLNIRRHLSLNCHGLPLPSYCAFSHRASYLEPRTKVTEGIQELSRRMNSCKTKRFFKSPITNSQPLHRADLGRSGEARECKYEEKILFRAQLTLEEKTLLKATWNTSRLINRSNGGRVL